MENSENWCADKVLDNPLSTPAQRTNARILLGMSKAEAMKLEEEEEDANLKAWENMERARKSEVIF